MVEFMAESRSNTLDRLLAYVVRARTEPAPTKDQVLPTQLGGVIINLTGPARTRKLRATFPGVPDCDWGFGVLQRTWREQSAEATVDDIDVGPSTRWLL